MRNFPRRQVLVLSLFLCLPGCQSTPAGPANSLGALTATLNSSMTGALALETVAYLQNFWRDGGNADFNQCMSYLAAQLRAHGYDSLDARYKLTVRNVVYEGEVAWQPEDASLRITGPLDTTIASLAAAKMSLCINSHPTPPGGLAAEIVSLESGSQIRPGEFRNKIVYTPDPPGQVFQQAARIGGAAGIISSFLPAYNQPASHPTSISMSSLPQTEDPAIFGFKISFGQAALLDSLLARGRVFGRARVAAGFAPKVVREVTAEIVGSEKADESIVLVAHVDEPGANDNASGAAELLEMAVRIRSLIEAGKLAPPARTIRMMWVEEIRTIRRLQRSEPALFAGVKAALVLDMVGENTRETGGTFLIEKTPDPSSIWTRPPDAHTEWGKSPFPRELMKGSYLNDLIWAACKAQSARQNWAIAQNPYEGGSDHVPFLTAGIPAVLAWHFTDVYYHTSGDDVEKVSAQEMANVGCSLGATAMFLASCTAADGRYVLKLLSQAAAWRQQNELENSLRALAANGSVDSLRHEQENILSAWHEWYHQAFESVHELPIDPPNRAFENEVQRQQEIIAEKYRESLRQIANVAK